MNNARLITLIGGGMVFVGLILLWLMMALLVRLTGEKRTPTGTEAPEMETGQPNGDSTDLLKAAAAAAGVALALQNLPHSLPNQSGNDQNSLWLNLGRSRQINASTIFARRKKN